MAVHRFENSTILDGRMARREPKCQAVEQYADFLVSYRSIDCPGRFPFGGFMPLFGYVWTMNVEFI
jgi:hypothetical protein